MTAALASKTTVTPAMAEWAASEVLTSEGSVRAVMVLDYRGTVLAHRRVVPTDGSSASEGENPLAIPILGIGLVFLKVTGQASSLLLREKVQSLFAFSRARIPP